MTVIVIHNDRVVSPDQNPFYRTFLPLPSHFSKLTMITASPSPRVPLLPGEKCAQFVTMEICEVDLRGSGGCVDKPLGHEIRWGREVEFNQRKGQCPEKHCKRGEREEEEEEGERVLVCLLLEAGQL